MLFEQNVFIMIRSYHKVCKTTTVYVFPNYVLSVQELCLRATVTNPLSDKRWAEKRQTVTYYQAANMVRRIYLCKYGLFLYHVSASDYTESNGSRPIIGKLSLRKIGKKCSCLKRGKFLENPSRTKKISYDCRCPDRDSKSTPPTYKSAVLPLRRLPTWVYQKLNYDNQITLYRPIA